MGGEKVKWRQLAHHQLMSQQGPHFSPHSKAKYNYKSINLRKIRNKWFKYCSVRFSSLRENPSEDVDEYDNFIIMNKSQETTVFHGRQKLTSAMN